MKKWLWIAMIGVVALSAQAALITDAVDDDGSWILSGGSWNSGLSAGISPVSGTNYYNIYMGANWSNNSIHKDVGIALHAGYTYVISVEFGDKDNTAFIPSAEPSSPYDNRLSFGFFDPTGVGGGTGVRNAIQALGAHADVDTAGFTRSIPSTDWSTWSYRFSVAEGSSLDGLTVDFGVGWNSGGDEGARGIAFDNLSIDVYEGLLLANGSGIVETSSSSNFTAKAAQAYALGSWLGYAANDEVGISGTMTLTGDDNTSMNDRVGFVFGTTASTVLNTGGSLVSTDYALIANTTIAYPGSNEAITVAKAGVKTSDNLRVAGAATGNSVNYAINLTFPANYHDGVNGLGHVYAYTFGLDYDKDGTYEYLESGTFDVYEENRTRFGFQVQKAPTDTALIFTNSYTYCIQEGHFNLGSVGTGFSGWMDSFGLSGSPDADPDFDYDGDGQINLYEYGLGGDPTNGLDRGTEPVFAIDGGTLEYVHVARTDDATLDYHLELTPELVISSWTNNGYSVTGTNDLGTGFAEITNTVPTDLDAKFIRLIIAQ